MVPAADMAAADDADADDDDAAPCANCSTLRAHLHCAQHAARLCLPCDLRLHAAALMGHRRAPLCDGCHAAPATARCAVHQALLCAPCGRAAGCHAQRHAARPARAYTGFAKPAELSRILFLSCDDDTTTPPPPPEPAAAAADTWVPDLVNIELLPDLPASWHDGNITSELLSSSLIETGGKFEGPMAGSAAAGDDDDDELFLHQDWPNLNDVVAGLDDVNFIPQDSDDLTNNSFSSMGHTEGAFEPQASPSLGYDDPLIASYSEPIIASTDAVLESMASNNAAYHQFNSVGPASTISSNNVASSSDHLRLPHAANTFYTSGVPMLPPADEFPGRHLGIEVKPPGLVAVSSQEAALQELSVPEQPSSQDMEVKTKLQEKRQEAKQRYKDKKKNRRFGKQIMYVSRKVRADTRNRVKGRFAKASSGSGVQGDDYQSTQHEDDEQPTNS